MIAQTWDYDKLGQTSWRASVVLGDETEPWRRTLGQREIPGARSKGLAVAYVNQLLTRLDRAGLDEAAVAAGGYFWGRVERGTYVDNSFDDDEHGWICDATWEPDTDSHGEPISVAAGIDPTGAIVWSGP